MGRGARGAEAGARDVVRDRGRGPNVLSSRGRQMDRGKGSTRNCTSTLFVLQAFCRSTPVSRLQIPMLARRCATTGV